MKIVDVRTHLVDFYRTNLVLIEVETDDGITGIGEGTLEHNELAVCGSINDMTAAVIGRDPRRIRRNFHDLDRDFYWRGGPVTMTALSALEMAMWDISGKALGVPAYELAGGRFRDRIKPYANGWFGGATTAEQFAKLAKETVDRGFLALKWDPFGPAYMTLTKAEFNASLECIDAVRQAVGPDIDLLIEAHGRFDVATAIAITKEIEQFHPGWIEEPIPPDNLDALAEVRAKCPIPIAAGERWYGTKGFAPVISRHLVDFIQPDICHAGGIGQLLALASMAEAHYIPFAPHNPNGPVATAATMQTAASAPNFRYLEMVVTAPPYRKDIVTEHLKFSDGYLEVPDGPGLGVEISFDRLAEHPYDQKRSRYFSEDRANRLGADAVAYF